MYCKIILIGRTGNDPEVRYFDNDNCVANISLATSESYKNKDGEKVENTQWHRLVLWKNTAKIAEKYVKKGHLISVEGKIVYKTYEGQDGVKKYTTEIVVDKLILINRGNGLESQQENKSEHVDDYTNKDNALPETEYEGDGLPF